MNKEQRAEEFLKDLAALCIKHKIQIAVSGYDNIELWDMYRGDPCIYSGTETENYLKELK